MFKFLILDFINPHKIRPYSDKHYYATHDPINENTSIYLGSLQSS
jgi:hypothetical protein